MSSVAFLRIRYVIMGFSLFFMAVGFAQTHKIILHTSSGTPTPDQPILAGNVVLCPNTVYEIRPIASPNSTSYDFLHSTTSTPFQYSTSRSGPFSSWPNSLNNQQGPVFIRVPSLASPVTLTVRKTGTTVATAITISTYTSVKPIFAGQLTGTACYNHSDQQGVVRSLNCTNCNHANTTYRWERYIPSMPVTFLNNGDFTSTVSGSFVTTADVKNRALNSTEGGLTQFNIHTERIESGGNVTCKDFTGVTLTTHSIPVLSGVSYPTVGGNTDNDVCLGVSNTTPNNNIHLTGTCTSNCPTSPSKGEYQWMFVDASITSPGAFGTTGTGYHYSTGLSPSATPAYNINEYDLHPHGLGLPVGTYQVHFQTENEHGCKAEIQAPTNLVVNDVPGVMAIAKGVDGTQNVTDNSLEVCTGARLQLTVKGCSDTDYPDPATDNVANNAADPTSPNIPTVTNPYTSPCLGTSGDYFKEVQWRVRKDGTTGPNSWYKLTASSTPVAHYKATNPNLMPNPSNFQTLTNPTTPATNTMLIGTEITGMAEYEVMVTGANGCTNTDVIKVTVKDPDISFETRRNGVAETHAAKATINSCIGEYLEAYPICDLCFPTQPFTTTWTGNPSPGTTTNNGIEITPPITSGNPVTSEHPIVANSSAKYSVGVTGYYGCTNSNVTSDDYFNTVGREVSGVHRIDFVLPLCTAGDLRVKVFDHASNSKYAIYEGDPATGTSRLVCSEDNSAPNPCQTSSVVSNNVIVRAPGEPPVVGKKYYVMIHKRSSIGGGQYAYFCPKKIPVTYSNTSGQVAATADVVTVVNPSSNFSVGGVSSSRMCNQGRSNRVWLNTGGQNPTASGWSINWSTAPGSSNPNATAGIDDPLPVGVLDPYLRAGYFCFGSYCIFPPIAELRIRPTSGYFTGITNGVPNSGGMIVTATITTPNGCEQRVEFPPVDFLNCDNPTLEAIQLTSSGTPNPLFGQALVEGAPEFASVCAGNGIRLIVESTASNLTYEWSSGQTTDTINIMTSQNSPDSIIRSVKVFTNPSDPTVFEVLTHKFYVSKGNIILYPDGDNNPSTIDTSICRNGIALAAASCLNCRGVVSYNWDSIGADTVENSNDRSYYQRSAPSTGTSFPLELEFKHGPLGSCTASYNRTIGINELPNPVVKYRANSTATADSLTASNANLVHKCTGTDAFLDVSCVGCNNPNYRWNTGATSPNLTVSSAGGYYVEVTDNNTCKATAPIAVVIEANTGYNSVAIADPAELCSGRSVDLEVPPCIGCSYKWFFQSAPPPASAVVQSSDRVAAVGTAGAYYGVVTNSEGCSYPTNTIVLNANVMTVPSITATTDTICNGQQSTLSTQGGVGFQYQWYKFVRGNAGLLGRWGPIAGATDSSYTTKVDSTGQYRVEVTYPNGCVEESPVLVISRGNFSPHINALSSDTICKGETIELITTLEPGWNYQWYRNGISIPGETGSRYYADSAGSYYVLVTNTNLCQASTNIVSLNKSTLDKPNASTVTPTICPGDNARLSVTICNDCEYQWFMVGGGSVSSISDLNFNYDSISATGNYYALVYQNSCQENSDTISITRNQVFTPAINAISDIVCDGVDASLVTQGCVGCSYTWLLNDLPALGALNDTFIVITSVNDIGDYRVKVDYPNGCTDTSAILTVTDGSFDASLIIDGTAPLDSVICNGIGEQLNITASAHLTGTYLYTLFLDNTPVTNQSNIAINSNIHTFPGDNPGIYTVQVINPNGCRAVSNILPLRSVNLSPVIASRATLDPISVPATALCTDSSSVVLEVNSGTCGSCHYQWRVGGVDSLGATNTVLQTDRAGLYIVVVEKDGCEAASNAISINSTIGTVNTVANTTDTSICNGNPVTLRYSGPTCLGCSYRWLKGQRVINGATTNQYVVSQTGNYFLEITTADGCIDQSDTIKVQEVTPPDTFSLDFRVMPNPATPLASNSSPINLNDWLTPNTIRRAALTLPDSGQFISTPFSANINCGGVIPCYPGLSGPGNQIFTPADSLAGFFQITYLYTTNGCTFSTSDILEVLEPAAITISNANPVSVPYEACIGDVLTIQTTNTDSAVGSLWAYDVNGNYVQMTPDTAIINRDTIFGTNTFWNTTIVWTVPDSAYASNLMLRYIGGQDSVLTPFLLIHNTDLTLSGLPSTGELCSNGEGLTLFGNPTGGTLSVVEASTRAPIPGVTVADTLYPHLIDPTLYSNGGQLVDVIYNYTETYTNGNTCPNPNQVVTRMDVRDVRLTGINYNPISVSQVREKLTNLVYRTYPYEARANKQPLYTSTFSGSFTSPAGAPEFFLPADAGIGRHALTYSIQNGTCINSIEDSITVVAAPAGLGIPDTICRDFGITAFGRSTSFPFNFSTPPPPNSTIAFMDSIHVLRVSGRGVTAVNTNLGAETFTYDPTAVGGNIDTLVMEYIFYRNEDTLTTGQPFDTLEYVVASIVQPIFIEDPITVQITDTIVSPFYCQDNTLKLLAASPPDTFGRGLYMLFGGTNQYQNGDTLFNSVINPFDVNNLENATTTYDLVYILNGVACRNADTMQITIARGLNPAFTTVTGQTVFCDDDPAVGIVHNVMAPDTAIWKIGGIPQPGYTFSPAALNPALHVVELQQIYTYATSTDTFFCSASAIDTFEIYPLPAVSISPALDAHYCANDTMVDFVVSPSPDCPVFGANGHYLLEESFDAGIPASWAVTTNAGSPWAPDAILPLGGVGGAAITDTSMAVNDAWLVSEPMNLVVGHTYRLSYMVRAGAAIPSCSGFCDASLRVAIGTAATPTAITAQLDYQPIINNDQTYVRYTVDHFHDPGAGFVTGTYYMGFHSFTPAFGRSLRLDDVAFRDLTVDSCAQAGIGFVSGPGAFKVVDSLYRFDPLAVPAGNITVAYEYTDIRGCSNITSYNVTVDTAPVVSFTNMDSSYCENEPTVMLTGSPLGGDFNSTFGHGGNLINIPFSAPLDTAFYPVNYQTNITGTDIVSYIYLDGNGCSEIAYDTVVIVPLVDVNVISQSLDPLGYGHCVDAVHTPLFVDAASGALFTNGVFYGPGVRNGAGGANDPANGAKFYPDSAVLDLGHTGDANLMYVYNTSTGCSDTTRFTTRVHALPDPYLANLPDSLCINADTFQVVAVNRVVTGPFGRTTFLDTIAANGGFYTVTDINGTPASDFIVLFDTLNPGAAGSSPWMNVEYLYRAPNSRGGCEVTIYDSVRIDSVPVVYFDGLRDYYCENEPSSIFLAFPSYYVGSGYLQIGSLRLDSSFYWIDPATMVGPGQTVATYPTYYTYMDSRGCVGEVFDTFQVRPYPRIAFTPNYQDTFCRQVGLYDLRQSLNAPIGGYFTDNLPLTSIVDSLYLNLNSSPGPRLVTYHYTDPLTQCSNKDSMWIYIFSSPELDFQAFGGCAQMDITFQGTASNLIRGVDSITGIWWDFEGNGNLTYTRLDTTPITIPDTMYQYATDGVYNVTLYVNNQGGCVESITKPLIISPYYNLATGDYFEDFNAGAGDWHSDQPTVVTPDSVWTHEFSITGNHINHNDGAWVVMKNKIYQENQQAWVYSPCYDFTTARRPMIAFDLWRDVLASIDGVVLEFYNNSTRQWELIGDIGQGIQWYQDFVLSRPGNQPLSVTNFPIGWTGRGGQFESARLRLDQFKGQRDVRFRIAFASAPSSVIDTSQNGYEGAAFDNVWVGERTRNVLVEHFSNENYTDAASRTSKTIDQAVYNKIFNSNYGLDVILLQYQVDKNGHTGDPIFQTNTGDLNARSLTYGAGPNDILIDGRSVGSGRSIDLSELDMDMDMLQFPAFDIRIDQPLMVTQGQLTAIATVEALQVMPNRRYTIRMAAIQDSLTFTGNTRPTVYHEMLSVVRKLMPNNSGTPEYHAWSIGQTATAREDWDFSLTPSFNSNQLEVVVFIQDDSTKEVYQAASTQDVNRFNGTHQLYDQDQRTEIFDVNVFPNPASELFNVAFKAPLSRAYNWRLIDVTGRTLQQGMAQAGIQQFGISADHLTDGAYFFIIHSEDNEVYAQRKLIVIKR